MKAHETTYFPPSKTPPILKMAENTEVPLVRGRKYIIIAPKIYPFTENISMNSEAQGYEVDD